MKNSLRFLAVAIAVMLLFPACNKEGKYTPKKKISRIESSVTNSLGTSITEIEEWEWDGDLLSKITYKFGNGEIYSTTKFQYGSDKRVESLNVVADSYTAKYEFVYEGKDLVKITRKESGAEDVDVYTFKKENGKVVEISLTEAASKSSADANILRYILPYDVAKCIKPSGSKATTTYKLIWDGKNVARLEAYAGGVLVMESGWTYDDKINPLAGLYSDNSIYSKEEIYSANNVLASYMTVQVMGIENTVYHAFAYEYDGKYPVERTWESENLGMVTGHKQTIHYK